MSLRPFLVASLAIVALGGCSAPRQGISLDDTPGSAKGLVPRTLDQTPFERTWHLDLGEPVHRAWTEPALPDLLFLQMAKSRRIVAIEALSGTTRWVSQALPDLISLPTSAVRTKVPTGQNGVLINDDRLYVIAQDTLQVLDAHTGHLIWRYELPFSPSTGALAVGRDATLRVFIGDWAGRMQVVSFHPEKGFPYPVWQWPLGTSIGADPVEREELIYAGDHRGVVHCFKLDRDQAWEQATGGSIAASPLVRDRLVFTGNADGVLMALSRLTGEPLGKLNLGAPVVRSPLAFRNEPDRIYVWVGSNDDTQTLVAVSAQADSIAYTDTARHPMEVVRLGIDWRRPAFERLIGSTPEYLYGAAKESSLVQALNRRTGRIDWTWDAAAVFPRATLAHLVTYQDPRDRLRSLFAIDEDGHVVAHRFFGSVPSDRDAPSDEPAPVAAPVMPAGHAKPKADAAAPAPAK